MIDKIKPKINKALGTFVEKTGTDKNKVIDKEEMRDKIEIAIEEDNPEMNQTDREIRTKHILQEFEQAIEDAKHIGKREERMKQEQEGQIYNMMLITMVMSGLTLIAFGWYIIG